MAALVLKLTLAPGLVAAATLIGRRFGPRAGGYAAGLPVVAGPILLIVAIEQGESFGQEAAVATLGGLVSLSAFIAAYGLLAPKLSPATTTLAAWGAFLACTALLYVVPLPLVPALIAAFASFGAAYKALEAPAEGAENGAAQKGGLPLRMGATAALVLAITGIAEAVGPKLSGLLTPFPIVTAVLAYFTHAGEGPAAAARLLRGLTAGLPSFAAFFVVVALTIEPLGIAASFAIATATALASHAVLLAAGVVR